MSTVAWRCSTNHFVRTAGEDALWKVQAQEDAGHSPHIDGIGEGEAQHDFWSSEKRGNVTTYLVSKGKSKKKTTKKQKTITPPNSARRYLYASACSIIPVLTSEKQRANPKSIILIVMSSVLANMMLSGFKSVWRILRSFRSSNASKSYKKIQNKDL